MFIYILFEINDYFNIIYLFYGIFEFLMIIFNLYLKELFFYYILLKGL